METITIANCESDYMIKIPAELSMFENGHHLIMQKKSKLTSDYINCRVGLKKVFVSAADLPQGFQLYLPSIDLVFMSRPVYENSKHIGHVIEFNEADCRRYNRYVGLENDKYDEGGYILYRRERVRRFLNDADSAKFVNLFMLLETTNYPPKILTHDGLQLDTKIKVTWYEPNIFTKSETYHMFLYSC
jgi:hypothetical protein